jgi:probable F420-dependent oxidoreductase
VKVFTGADPRMGLGDVGAYAQRVEAAGYDGMHVSETVHDPFLLALIALQSTSRIVVRTSVALAFVRSPLLTAYTAWDLARMSGGRFHLGLGSQIRQNIEQRYAMPWAEPAARMAEYVHVVRAAFETFRTGTLTPFEGEHYRFTRMQPYFNPHDATDAETPCPPIYLGGVGRRMCTVAGEVADGLITHPTGSSPSFLQQDVRPALAAGAAAAGRNPADCELVAGFQVITGETEADLDAERERHRRQFAFLYSTPEYRCELERCGLGDLREPLARMVRANDWGLLRELVTDEVLDAMLPSARYGELPELIHERIGGLADAVTLPLPADPARDRAMADVVRRLRDLD